MSSARVLAIDQGTTSTRARVFDGTGMAIADASLQLPQHFPHDGWVEHDPEDIWSATASVVRGAASRSSGTIAAIGITNQRETTVVWDRASGRAIHPAIVWQDRRTADACATLREHEALVSARTGLLLDPY
ncbi:MAG: glycerol kinase, partial [Planctomycetes bacterium]|nr:glycerol kinase [Planctomycetota bacterium]